jgi:hypothetical protein
MWLRSPASKLEARLCDRNVAAEAGRVLAGAGTEARREGDAVMATGGVEGVVLDDWNPSS